MNRKRSRATNPQDPTSLAYSLPQGFYLLRVLKPFPATVPVRVGTHDPGATPSTLGELYESCVERLGIHLLGTFLQARG